jgi:DNA invertase Pin-like site-specific DNA recombinase
VTARGWEVAAEFSDLGVSGSRERRHGLDGLMGTARRREIDIVVVAAFDRFARSVRHLVDALEEFNALGIQFASLREGIDTSIPSGRFMFHVIAAVAEFEREMIRERIKAGLAAARRRGTRTGRKIGRPKKFVSAVRAQRLLDEGHPATEVARRLGVSARSLVRAMKAHQAGPQPVGGVDTASGKTMQSDGPRSALPSASEFRDVAAAQSDDSAVPDAPPVPDDDQTTPVPGTGGFGSYIADDEAESATPVQSTTTRYATGIPLTIVTRDRPVQSTTTPDAPGIPQPGAEVAAARPALRHARFKTHDQPPSSMRTADAAADVRDDDLGGFGENLDPITTSGSGSTE